MLLAVFERAALLLMVLFWLTRLHLIQTIVQKTERRPTETALLAALFIGFALFSTYTGVNVDGSLVNVRIIAIVAGGILFGPWVGISAGVVSGLHRYLIDIDGPTSQACLIASIVAGLLSALIHYRADKIHYARYGILVGMVCEALTMGLIVLLAEDHPLAYNIVSHISFPMIAGTLCIGLIIQLVQHIDDEKERLAALQAKQALHIATQTLPYFRQGGRSALTKGCQVIRHNTQADAVAITDTQDVLAYVGIGEEEYLDAHHQISELTQQAVKLGQQIISNNLNLYHFRSLLIIPLWENQQVTGTLKIFYRQPNRIHRPLKEMAI
ncbi:sensor histidine kinase, partial [Vibrio sp. V26_P1S5P106]|nr:sensor histidine kinase [Vibrio sp. V26_P1S5P106]